MSMTVYDKTRENYEADIIHVVLGTGIRFQYNKYYLKFGLDLQLTASNESKINVEHIESSVAQLNFALGYYFWRISQNEI